MAWTEAQAKAFDDICQEYLSKNPESDLATVRQTISASPARENILELVTQHGIEPFARITRPGAWYFDSVYRGLFFLREQIENAAGLEEYGRTLAVVSNDLSMLKSRHGRDAYLLTFYFNILKSFKSKITCVQALNEFGTAAVAIAQTSETVFGQVSWFSEKIRSAAELQAYGDVLAALEKQTDHEHLFWFGIQAAEPAVQSPSELADYADDFIAIKAAAELAAKYAQYRVKDHPYDAIIEKFDSSRNAKFKQRLEAVLAALPEPEQYQRYDDGSTHEVDLYSDIRSGVNHLLWALKRREPKPVPVVPDPSEVYDASRFDRMFREL